MAQLRAVFTASRHLIGILLYTIALHIYAFILAAIMQRLGVAHCLVANELLRRRDQLDCDDAPQPRNEDVKGETSQLRPAKVQRFEEQKGDELDTSLLETGSTMSRPSADRTVTHTIAHSSGVALSMSTQPCRRYLGMWTPALKENRMADTILMALRRQAEMTERQRINVQSKSKSQSDSSQPTQSSQQESLSSCVEVQLEPNLSSTETREQEEQEYALATETLQQVNEVGDDHLMASSPSSNAEGWGYTSPCSETTLAEDQNTYCLSLPGATQVLVIDNFRGDQESICTPVSLVQQTPEHTVTRGRTRTRKLPLNESSRRSVGTPSRIFGNRQRTDEGLLELHANASKEHVTPVRGHRRKVSLNLPVRHRAANSRSFQFPSPKTRWENPPCQTMVSNQTPPAVTLIQEERELEYKHRHTFIGTASLDVFLEILEMSASHTVTTSAVTKAFTTLASNEQMLARQSSSRKDGWDVVSRITLDVQAPDYITQAHIKLGSITLRQFLDLIPFDANERADAMAVLEAFCAASHMDRRAGTGTGSKAQAFRSWMVRQNEGRA